MWNASPDSLSGRYDMEKDLLRVTVSGTQENAFVRFVYEFPAEGNEYILFPGCCYNGNRFRSLKKAYPPSLSPQEGGINMPVTITDVPRLNEDGSGRIEVTTGDVSVPCIGIFSQKRERGLLLFTIQEIMGENLGLSYETGRISVSFPHMRSSVYRWPYLTDRRDPGRRFEDGEHISIPYRLFDFPCRSIEEFYRIFFQYRKCMGLDDSRPEVLPFSDQFAIQCEKFNAMNWRPAGGFYGVGTEDSPEQTWQPGWVGGAVSSYPMMKLGGSPEWERGLRTLAHLFSTQADSGFFHSLADSEGHVVSGPPGTPSFHLIRESADVLYFLFKHFELIRERGREIPAAWEQGTRRLADAFLTLWERYSQLGQFVDANTGELILGGSTSGAIAPAGLARAARWFGEPRYLDAAKAIAEQYVLRDVLNGYTTGGPGDALQCPDSESAFGLLESMTVLYEETGEPIWLSRAEFLACFCSSWVTAYNYRFPASSEFGRLGMKTVGSVFANVQNKHAAPGICCLSGDSLYRLWRWTGNDAYLALCLDVGLPISQYLSTNARPIFSWDVPKDPTLFGDDPPHVPPEKLPQGFMCERVNLSDWEGSRCVGGVFNGSCWCETSNLLVLAEVIPLLRRDGLLEN